MSSRPSSRLCVPLGRLVLSIRSSRCLLVSFLFVSLGVSFLISFYRLVLLARFVLLICVSPGRLVLFRAAVSPSRRIVLPGRLACSSRFFPIHLSYRLADLDRAFLRGGAYHPDVHASRSTAAR